MSYVRSRAERFGIDRSSSENFDIHVHLPEGAIPKDGPSAGVTMATALVSALTRIPVRRDVAMTGEITLRGRVLPIGGLKEKALAAHRAGIKTVLIPKENKKDLKDIPKKIRKQLRIVPVEFVDEVLREALVLEKPEEFGRKAALRGRHPDGSGPGAAGLRSRRALPGVSRTPHGVTRAARTRGLDRASPVSWLRRFCTTRAFGVQPASGGSARSTRWWSLLVLCWPGPAGPVASSRSRA